jgi:outer membrane protein assembly factor BamB
MRESGYHLTLSGVILGLVVTQVACGCSRPDSQAGPDASTPPGPDASTSPADASSFDAGTLSDAALCNCTMNPNGLACIDGRCGCNSDFDCPGGGTCNFTTFQCTATDGGCQLDAGNTIGCIQFTPDPIAFGTVTVGTTVTANVSVTNCGNITVSVTSLTTESGNSPFSIQSSPTLPVSVPAGASFDLTMAFSPTVGSINSDNLLVVFVTADPGVPPQTAVDPMIGTQQQGCLISLVPASLNFGFVTVNAPVTRTVTISNAGGLTCQVSNIAIGPSSYPGFALASPGTTSFAVSPNGSATIPVTYSIATGSGPYLRNGTLTFQTNDPSLPTATVQLIAHIPQPPYSTGWPKWHFDNRNSGQCEADTSVLTGTLEWKFQVGVPSGSTYINSPVVDASGTVYQLGMDGTLYAVNENGSQLWSLSVSAPTGDPHPSTPTILADHSMYLVTGEGSPPNLYFINPTGSVLFMEAFGANGFAAVPVVSTDGGILFEADNAGPAATGGGSDPNSALAFSTSGSVVSETAGVALPLSSESKRFGIAVSNDGTSYWANNGQYFAVTSGFQLLSTWPSTGVTIATSAMGPVNSDLAIDEQVNNFVYGYSAWEGLDAAGNTTVQGVLVAMNPGDGSIAWIIQLPASSIGAAPATAADFGNSAPAVADDGAVYVGNGDGLRSVQGATGAVNWLFQSADVTSSPAIGGDGTIFFGVKDGTFFAVNPDGSLRFKITAGAQISSSPAIASDGTVYFVSDDGYLYAVK